MQKIFLSLLLVMLAACGGNESSEHYLSEAKGYLAEADYASAAIELQNALRLDTTSAEARWLLGKIYLDTGNVLAAEKELQRAQELGWNANEIRPALARILLAQGRFAEVLELDYQGLDSREASELLASQAIAALAEGRMESARELVALAQEKAPGSSEAKLARATIAIHQGETTAALKVIDAVLQGEPENGQAWRLKGQALLRMQKLGQARDAFDQAILHSRIAFADRVARALINVQFKDYEAAQADATILLAISPQDPSANYIQGLLLFQNKQYRDAISALTLAEPAATQFPLIFYYLGLAYLIENDVALAARFANQYVAASPGNESGRKLYAIILLQQQKVDEAQSVLRPVLENNPEDIGALNIMANALLLDGQAYAGLVRYARILQLQPDWPIIPLRMEARLVTAGAVDEVGDLQGMALDTNTNFPQTEILQILSALGKKDYPAAITEAKSYQFRAPESLAPYYVLGKVYLAAGRQEDAREVFEKVLKREPGDSFANLNLAQLALEAKDPDAARSYYQTVLDEHPDDLTTLLQLAALEARSDKEASMVARLKQAMEAHPNTLEPRLVMARYYLSSTTPEKVIPLFSTLDALQQRSPRVLELTALAQLAQQQNASALVTLQQLVDARPASAQYRYLLARAAGIAGETQRSKKELLEAVRLDPNHIPALFNLSRITLIEGDKEQGRQYIATLAELAPGETDVLRLQATLEKLNGNIVEALALSQRAFMQTPTSQTLLELTGYQLAAGKNAEARSAMRQWIKKNPQDVAVRLGLGNQLDVEANHAGAKAQYLAVLELEPNNVVALNNLAWHLKSDNPEKALEYGRRAAARAPDNPAVLDTLAVVEHLNGNDTIARDHIQRALASMPDELSMRYHAAMITAALGEKETAIAALEELLAEDAGDFPERAEAEELLQQLKG